MRTTHQVAIAASQRGRKTQLLFNPRYSYLHKQKRLADSPRLIYDLSCSGLVHQSAVQQGTLLAKTYVILSNSKLNRIFQSMGRCGLHRTESIIPPRKGGNDVQSRRLNRQGLNKAALYIHTALAIDRSRKQ